MVNADYRQLFQDLTELKQRIVESDALPDAEKFDIAVDIETLKDQLAKPRPDRAVVQRLWPRIEKAANVAGLGQFLVAAGQAIGQLLS